MCHSTTLNNKINKIQERALKIVYNGYKSNFKELLEQDHSVTIHERNIQYLAAVIMNDVFQFGKNSAYDLRSGNHLQRTNM